MKILNLAIKSPGRPDIVLPIPEGGKPQSPWFTLKEGSKYSLKFSFLVTNNIVTGLKYTNTVWKTGIKGTSYALLSLSYVKMWRRLLKMFLIKCLFLFFTKPISVDSTKQMIGAFSPQSEPYTHEMPEDLTPSGMFARGSYSAKTKVIILCLTCAEHILRLLFDLAVILYYILYSRTEYLPLLLNLVILCALILCTD